MQAIKSWMKTGLLLIMILPAAALAGDFEQARVITGAVDRLIEINRQRVIEDVDPDTVGLPKTFIIDLDQRTLRGAPDSLVRRLAAVERITRTPTTLILQGVDEGLAGPAGVFGWNLAIDTATGRAVLSAVGSGIAYVAFGTCSAPAAAAEGGAASTP